MDTKPIFDFFLEVKNQSHFVFPHGEFSADEDTQLKYYRQYFSLLKKLEEEFEACVFQCMSENPEFREQLQIIANRLGKTVDFHTKLAEKYIRKSPHSEAERLAANMGKIGLRHLKDIYGIEAGVTKPIKDAMKQDNTAVEDKIDWDKPVYTADEIKALLDISDSTFTRWLNKGWIAYSQVAGSDKKLIQREDLFAFLNNPKIYYPSTK